jgi:hypothetical protein
MAPSPEPFDRTPAPAGVRRLDGPLLRPDQAAELLSVKGELVRRGLVAPQSDLGVVVVGRDPTSTGAVAIGDSVSPQRGARLLAACVTRSAERWTPEICTRAAL